MAIKYTARGKQKKKYGGIITPPFTQPMGITMPTFAQTWNQNVPNRPAASTQPASPGMSAYAMRYARQAQANRVPYNQYTIKPTATVMPDTYARQKYALAAQGNASDVGASWGGLGGGGYEWTPNNTGGGGNGYGSSGYGYGYGGGYGNEFSSCQ